MSYGAIRPVGTEATSGTLHVVVDAANVVGSRPDGWWRDRAGAAGRLAARIAAVLEDPPALAAALPGGEGRTPTVHLVVEGAARDLDDPPAQPLLRLVRAERDGDTAIVDLATELAGAAGPVLVVTADRVLRLRVRAVGAEVVGPGTFAAALPEVRGDDVQG